MLGLWWLLGVCWVGGAIGGSGHASHKNHAHNKSKSALEKLYFGYYDGLVNETLPYSNLNLAGSVQDAVAINLAATKIGRKVDALLEVRTVFFDGAKLNTDFMQKWNAVAEVSRELLKNGTIIGFNLGDELVWNCVSPADVKTAADTVRKTFARGEAIIWYNEAAFFGRPKHEWNNECGPVPDFAIPSALDWFSIDMYHMDGYVEGWVDAWPKQFYEKYIYPNLTEAQKVMLVPGAFGSNVNHYPNGTYICNNSCYDNMCSKDAVDFYQWAKNDNKVAAICPWNWRGCPECNGSRFTPPHTCCMDEIGANAQIKTKTAWAEIGRMIEPINSYFTTLWE